MVVKRQPAQLHRHSKVWRSISGSLLVIVGLAWFTLQSAAHYQAYERLETALIQALQLEGRPAAYDPWRDLEPLTDAAAIARARQALQDAGRLVGDQPTSIAAHRYRGQLALLVGEPEVAISAFSEAVKLQPDSMLLWLELGMAYERLAGPDLLHPDPVLVWLSSPHRRAALMVSEVKPDWHIWTEPVRRTLIIGDELRLRAILPTLPTLLVFRIGNPPSSTVTYQVAVNAEPIAVYQHGAGGDEQWPLVRVDLSKWAGQSIDLYLTADHPQAVWGDVQIIGMGTWPCVLVDCWQRAAMAWHQGGSTATLFGQKGMLALRQKAYPEALVWFRRAAALGLDTTSIMWYTNYLMTSDQAALEQSVVADRGWIRDDLAFEAWYKWGIALRRYEPKRSLEAEQAFRQAIALAGLLPDSGWRLSDAYLNLGFALWDQQRLHEALSAMATSLEFNPNSAAANVYYGMLIYILDRTRVEETEHRFAVALTLDSDPNRWKELINFWKILNEPARALALCVQARQVGIDMAVLASCQ